MGSQKKVSYIFDLVVNLQICLWIPAKNWIKQWHSYMLHGSHFRFSTEIKFPLSDIFCVLFQIQLCPTPPPPKVLNLCFNTSVLSCYEHRGGTNTQVMWTQWLCESTGYMNTQAMWTHRLCEHTGYVNIKITSVNHCYWNFQAPLVM